MKPVVSFEMVRCASGWERLGVAHLMPTAELDLTEEEAADDAAARVSDGRQGRFAHLLAPRMLCGRRVDVFGHGADSLVGVSRHCPGCYGKKR